MPELNQVNPEEMAAGLFLDRIQADPKPTRGALIYGLMAQVIKAVRPVGKEGRNVQQNYSFRALDDFMNAVNPALSETGVFVLPTVLSRQETERTNQKGNTSLHVVLRIAFDFYAPDGSSVRAITEGEAADYSDKATNKAMSAAFKYCLMQGLCIPLKDMAEGDKESPELGQRTTKAVAPSVDEQTGEIRGEPVVGDESPWVKISDIGPEMTKDTAKGVMVYWPIKTSDGHKGITKRGDLAKALIRLFNEKREIRPAWDASHKVHELVDIQVKPLEEEAEVL